MRSLKWSQVNAWRLSNHYLSHRLERKQFSEAIRSTGGIQAQVMSAAELALWARTDGLTLEDIRSALWEERTLVKTWAMRATLHLLRSDDLPLYVAARSAHTSRNWQAYFTFFGITPEQMDAIVAAVPDVLGSKPMTRQQLAESIARELKVPGLSASLLSSSWGSLWKPSAWRGDLCFGPSQGQNVTFINPRRWLGNWQLPEPYAALQEVARRYLHAYGPATYKQFALWWGGALTHARKLFKSLETELELVDVEGWQGWVLQEDLPLIRASRLSGTVHLLPLFDAYILGIGRGKDIEFLLPQAYQKQVYRPQGWISAVVLNNGFIQGMWEFKKRGPETFMEVTLFSALTPRLRKGIEAEAERLGKFLNTHISLNIEPG